jgi:AcrR family transcriptional regulator
MTRSREGERRPRATRADVIVAGVAIAAQQGFASVTLSAVADRMAVGRTTLYHHFPGGLGEIRSAVVEEIARLLGGDDQGDAAGTDPLTGWQQRTLRQVGRASREYPGVLEYLLTVGRDERYTVAATDVLVTLLQASDLGPMAVEAWAIMHAYITGWVTARRPSAETAERLGFDDLATALREVEKLDPDAVLFDGLQALLSGLMTLRRTGESNPR